MSPEVLDRLARAVAVGRIGAPPITRIALDDAPAALDQSRRGHADGKTVIAL